MSATTISTKPAAILRCAVLFAASLCLPTQVALAQSPHEAPGARPVTVVTLYSESRHAPGTVPDEGKPQRPLIQIVDRGVKSAGPSCWNLTESGQIVPVAGDCYILRSAEPGEKPPVH
ncbi:hypothetical protein Cmtc_58830 [Cupriavidus sp. TKC]|uniref:hypothetical protein n=1 Tax=Cupriavidus sp. SHE TaxID=1539143 RepID=UPI0012DFF881|nr:hypothetical protein [Cupriavidus sp. SHE]GMG94663.1 hypothetical protein Cmtc_58830 [Cupriavidus sp. TKC]